MLVQHSILTALHLFTVRLLEPGQFVLKEDYLITTFFEDKRFWSFFAKKFKVQLDAFELT